MITLSVSDTFFAPLSAHLLDLLFELEGEDIPLIMVGGYSLYLRRLLVEKTGATTLYPTIPSLRATEDFDLVLKLELLADTSKVEILRAAIDKLGYHVVQSAAKYQFFKPGTAWRGHPDVKIDLLARTPDPGDPQLRYDDRRVYPRSTHNPLHSHATPEAIAVEDGLEEIALSGNRTSGELHVGTIFLPPPYAIYLMKLFAFRDEETVKKGPGREPFARKHALDLYALTALLTEDEYDSLKAYQAKYSVHPITQEAGLIVSEHFSSHATRGTLRIQEHGSFPTTNQLGDFLDLLADIFPTNEPGNQQAEV